MILEDLLEQKPLDVLLAFSEDELRAYFKPVTDMEPAPTQTLITKLEAVQGVKDQIEALKDEGSPFAPKKKAKRKTADDLKAELDQMDSLLL